MQPSIPLPVRYVHYLQLDPSSTTPHLDSIHAALQSHPHTQFSISLPHLNLTAQTNSPLQFLQSLSAVGHPATPQYPFQLSLNIPSITPQLSTALQLPAVTNLSISPNNSSANLTYALPVRTPTQHHLTPILQAIHRANMQPSVNHLHPIRHITLPLSSNTHLLRDMDRVVDILPLDQPYVTVLFAGTPRQLYEALHALQPAILPSNAFLTSRRNVTLRVDNMMCMGCVGSVTRALQAVPGAADVQVLLDDGQATLTYDGQEADTLAEAVVEESGKPATVIAERFIDPNPTPVDSPQEPLNTEVVLKVAGMTCMGCVGRVERALAAVEGTTDVQVSLENATAKMRFEGCDPTVLIDAVKEVGKVATLLEQEDIEDSAVVQEVVSLTPPVQQDDSPASLKAVTLRVDGMMCVANCVRKVTNALEAVEGTSDVKVSLDDGQATLLFGGVDTSVLVKAVADHARKVAIVIVEDLTSPVDHTMVDIALESPHEPPISNEVSPSVPIATPVIASEARSPVSSVTSIEMLSTTRIRVGGMTCSNCQGIVEGVLNDVYGVSTSKVNLLACLATVYHEAVTKPEELGKAVVGAGYQALILETISPNDAIKPASSKASFRVVFSTEVQANNATKFLRLMSSVESAHTTGSHITITMKTGCSKSSVISALETDGGFGQLSVRLSESEERKAFLRGASTSGTEVIEEEARTWRNRLFLSLSFFIPVMIITFLHHHTSMLSMNFVRWSTFLLATPVQFICGAGFYRASYYALKKKRATMDVLIALSTSIAYFSSVTVVLLGMTSYGGKMSLGHSAMFNVSVMIITMVLFGKWLESTAKRRAAAGVAALSALAPDDAILYDVKKKKACITRVPVSVLNYGDIVKLNAGDRVAVDGEVIQGSSAVDESMLTGESNPVPKRTEDFVYGGTVNGRGTMLVRTTAVGSDAVLSQIVKLVNDAQTSRAPIEAYADKVSAVFVPTVVSLSLVVFIGWLSAATFGWIPTDWYSEEGPLYFALLFALETMVIACPCALGLATPTAVLVASEMGTKLGVLFRGGGAALEAASNVKTVLFDKTGTLTIGKPEVVSVLVSEGCSLEEENASVVLSDIIMMVEAESHHPLAGAITRFIRKSSGADGFSKSSYEISDLEELAGRGIRATVNNGSYEVRIGSREWAYGSSGADLERALLTVDELSQVERMESEDGLTVVTAVINDSMVVVYGLEDTLRPEAVGVVRFLQGMGMRCGLVTGDSEETARAIARKVGLDASVVVSRAMPWTKVDVVQQARENGGVAFVGDGINDAPALAAADVGIAIGAGAAVATESAAVVLVRSDLTGVVNTLNLAKETFRRVRLNFVWAIGYNVLGIPIAAGALYPLFRIRVPAFLASGAMALSSTCVIVSSLALRWYKAPKGIDGSAALERRAANGTDVEMDVFTIDDDEAIVRQPLLNGVQNV